MRLKLPANTDSADFDRNFRSPTWQRAAEIICSQHSLTYSHLRRSEVGENVIFFVDERFVIKIYAPVRGQYLREQAALQVAASAKLSIETPQLVHIGELEDWHYIVMTQLTGMPIKEVWTAMVANEQLEIASQLGIVMKELHALASPSSEGPLNRDWHGFVARQARESVERQRTCDANPEWLESLPAFLASRLQALPADFEPVLLHGDVHLGNLLVRRIKGRWGINGLFDFADSFCGFNEYEFVAPGVLMVQGRRELQREMFLAYGHKESDLDVGFRARLMLLTVLYECSDLRKYALRLAPNAVALSLEELERAIWPFATT